jgi:hypothetical protein
MANRGAREWRIALLTALAVVYAIIATAFVAQGIFKAGAREMLKQCRMGNPACWPRPPHKQPKTPPEKA